MQKSTIVNKIIKIVFVIIIIQLVFVIIGFALGRYGKPLQVVNSIYFLLIFEAVLIFIRDRKQL